MKTVTNSLTSIKYLINNNNNSYCIKSNSGVYAIQRLGWNKKYVGETSHNRQKRIYKHERNLILWNMNNGMVWHNLETIHSFNLKDSKMFIYIHNIKY